MDVLLQLHRQHRTLRRMHPATWTRTITMTMLNILQGRLDLFQTGLVPLLRGLAKVNLLAKRI
jgi:hypothetical protein